MNRSLSGKDPRTPVLVLSGRDYFWYLFLQRPSVLRNAGFNHMFLKSEIDELCQMLEERRAPVVVWDATYLQSPLPNYGYGYVSTEEKERLLEVLKRRYEKREEFSGKDDLPLSVWVVPNAK